MISCQICDKYICSTFGNFWLTKGPTLVINQPHQSMALNMGKARDGHQPSNQAEQTNNRENQFK